jgi:hypothetical protein
MAAVTAVEKLKKWVADNLQTLQGVQVEDRGTLTQAKQVEMSVANVL